VPRTNFEWSRKEADLLESKKKKTPFLQTKQHHNNVRSSSQSHQRGGENADRTHPLGETAHFLFSGGA
jgi:16S rRNA G527 N7-methylase RsmG